jgi:hypothetical protein
MHADAREISALVAMPDLLAGLGFGVNERTRRASCVLHSGSNPTAFSWRENGRWHCFSCGAGGDRIALVRAAKRCSFREAVEFLAGLAGVQFHSRPVSRRDAARTRRRRTQAERAAWKIVDEIGRLRRYYTDALHRAERLQCRIGNELLRTSAEGARDGAWRQMGRLAPVCTFFFAARNFIWDAKPNTLAHFALASPADRRQFILEGVAP